MRSSLRPLAYASLSTAVIFAAACNDTGTTSKPASSAAAAANPAFSSFVDTYFDSTFSYQPSSATAAGFHQYDSKIEDLSAPTVTRRIATLKLLQTRLDSLKAAPSTASDSIDALMIDGAIKSELQDLEVIGSWKKNPMNYVGTPGNAVDLLMKRNFAPPAERLKSLTARLRGVPALIAAMKANVNNPPKEFTDLAIRIAGGSVGFFKADVATWAKSAAGTDSAALREFTAVNDSAAAALGDAAKWLKSDLLPRSKGSFAIGEKAFADKLLFDLKQLVQVAEGHLRLDHPEFSQVAASLALFCAEGRTKAVHLAESENVCFVVKLSSLRQIGFFIEVGDFEQV